MFQSVSVCVCSSPFDHQQGLSSATRLQRLLQIQFLLSRFSTHKDQKTYRKPGVWWWVVGKTPFQSTLFKARHTRTIQPRQEQQWRQKYKQTKHWSYLQSCIPPRLAYLLPKPFELFTLTYLHRLCRNSTFSVIKECGLAKKYGHWSQCIPPSSVGSPHYS